MALTIAKDRMSLLQAETTGDDTGAPDPVSPTYGGAHTHPANFRCVEKKTRTGFP